MPICIFCASALDKATKPEHILISAFGGRKTTRRVICSPCNNQFGGGIDRSFAEQFAGIRNMLRLNSGTRQPPPARRDVWAGRDKIDIAGDGTISLRAKPFTITTGPNGSQQLHISAGSLEKIAEMIPHMAAALKVSEEKLRELISQQEGMFVERRPDPIPLDLQFGESDMVRSVAKSCLVLWATLVGNDEVVGACFQHIRKFILGERIDPPGGDKSDLDSRIVDLPEGVAAEYGPVFNMIYVKSDRAGKVVGHFTVFNIVGSSVVLAEAGGSPERQIALVANPITGAWTDKIAEKLDIPFEWLASPDYDAETMNRTNQRFGKLMEYYSSSSRSNELGRIIGDVLRSHGLNEGNQIPMEIAASVSKEIAERAACHVFNRPYKKQISAAQVREMLRAEAARLKEADK